MKLADLAAQDPTAYAGLEAYLGQAAATAAWTARTARVPGGGVATASSPG